jgi:glycosyltransferase involved in cell wall biosynthesis
MKLVTYHLTGNANVKAALIGFAKANLLEEFHVTIANFPNSTLDTIGSFTPFSEIKRRSFDPILKPFAKTRPLLEIARLLAPRIGCIKLTQAEGSLFHVDAVVQDQDRSVASRLKYLKKKGIDSVYGYEDCSIHSFREAKQLGLQCIYDLPIGYWRTAHRLLKEEYLRWPEWMSTMPGLTDSREKISRKEEELQLANKIIVASSFTAKTLKEYPGVLAPIEVIPYGYPNVIKNTRLYENQERRALKLLFVGSLSQRKGIADLFAAVENLKSYVKLTVVGKKITDNCQPLNVALAKHQWYPSLPHHEILDLMRNHDILVFPSLFEGFGLVITEAMSQGTPVITTDRTAGPDLIEHGDNGWLIKAGSTSELQMALEELLSKPKQITKIGKAAMESARSRPWDVYGKELAEAVTRLRK